MRLQLFILFVLSILFSQCDRSEDSHEKLKTNGKLQQMKTIKLDINDSLSNTLTIESKINFNYSIDTITNSQDQHLTLILDSIFSQNIKSLLSKYSYIDIYSSMREELEIKLEELLKPSLEPHLIILNYVELYDVWLPDHLLDEYEQKVTHANKD